MQKRMFRDKFGLTDLVLSGQKTQTRDVIKIQDERLDYLRGWNLDGGFAEFGRAGEEPLKLYPKYYVGEMVAVAQSYQKAYPNADFEMVDKWTFMTESAGWKNKAHWHVGKGGSAARSAAIGNHTGRNHEVGRKIVEMCRHYGIEVVEQPPLRKIWKGKDGKITHEELQIFTGITGKTNQEARDAALLAWEYAGLPIKIITN